ncbi:MAG TPA: hypothetical protein VN108_05320 [Marmoricola sp.]|nr:hypothetical protein [Marmoricola sp.]
MGTFEPLPTRRGFLTLAAAGALSACATNAAPAASRSAAETATTPASSTPALPHPPLWSPNRGDLVPAAKLAAVRHIEHAGTGAQNRVQVLEAQYGGLLSTTASVLVACQSWTLREGRIVTGGHTFDVRLTLRGSRWMVTSVNPSHPGLPASRLTTAARHVLASHRIVLPPAAHADVASGQVHDTVLETMLRMSQRWVVGVSVIRSGHPTYVFGTNRLSDHPRGRAFDTWAIDGHPVVAPQTSRSLIADYMERLAALGSYNVGGPMSLGSAPQYFSDNTHHDHVHAGFSR